MSDLIIGFTGTRDGMNAWQHRAVFRALEQLRPIEVHHGDCVGADAQFHAICYSMFPDIRFVIHPPRNNRLRAFCKAGNIEFMEPLPYLVRDKNITIACHKLFGAPRTNSRSRGSGTWATIGFAEFFQKPVLLFQPNGTEKWL